MKHAWSLICEKSTIDSETNALSIFNCIEELNAVVDVLKVPNPTQIMIPLSFQIISVWELDGENSMDLEIKIVDPEGLAVHSLNPKFTIDKPYKRYRCRINIQSIPVSKNGRYIIKINRKSDGETKYKTESEISLDIQISLQDVNSTYDKNN